MALHAVIYTSIISDLTVKITPNCPVQSSRTILLLLRSSFQNENLVIAQWFLSAHKIKSKFPTEAYKAFPDPAPAWLLPASPPLLSHDVFLSHLCIIIGLR